MAITIACLSGLLLGGLAALADADVGFAVMSFFWLGFIWIPALALATLALRRLTGTRIRLLAFAAGAAGGQLSVRSVSSLGDEIQHLYVTVVPALIFFAALLVANLATAAVRRLNTTPPNTRLQA